MPALDKTIRIIAFLRSFYSLTFIAKIKPMRIEIKGMAPLFQVFDMPAAIYFYRDILGFELVQSSSPGDDCDWCLLKLQETELMLNTAYEKEYRPAGPDPVRVSHHDDTALYFGCPDVEAAYNYLAAKGVNFLKSPYITGYGFKAMDIADPDGYHLCFHWPVK